MQIKTFDEAFAECDNLKPVLVNYAVSNAEKFSALFLSSGEWRDFITNDAVEDGFDPALTHDNIRVGYVGTLFGVPVYTDAFEHHNNRKLSISMAQMLERTEE